jgi:hypothetical protein
MSCEWIIYMMEEQSQIDYHHRSCHGLHLEYLLHAGEVFICCRNLLTLFLICWLLCEVSTLGPGICFESTQSAVHSCFRKQCVLKLILSFNHMVFFIDFLQRYNILHSIPAVDTSLQKLLWQCAEKMIMRHVNITFRAGECGLLSGNRKGKPSSLVLNLP